MENLPIYVSFTFGLTVLATVWQFYRATHHSKRFLIGIIVWIALQSVLALSGIYIVSNTIPPRLAMAALPPFILLIGMLSFPNGRRFINGLDVKHLTLLHVIRIPVELVLYWLYLYKSVPVLMTFEGRNFDIFSGLSAPFVWYFGFVKPKLKTAVIIIWNFICLGLLLNIAAIAMLSTKSRIQQFGFGQPNIALGYFPFMLLPACIVPLVLLSHVASLGQLLKK